MDIIQYVLGVKLCIKFYINVFTQLFTIIYEI